VDLAWASPGHSVRIVKVLDAVEPRSGGHRLRGMAVVAAGYLPRAQEAIVDMSGPAAGLSPLGATHNLVVEFEPADGAAWEDVDDALRRGLLRLAVHLADAGLDSPADTVEVVPGGIERDRGSALPRVGAVTNLQTQCAFKDVFVYGRRFGTSLPTLLDAGDLDDGAVVSGQYGHPGLKNPTYVHQNHPVVDALRARHGRDLVFAGVVLSPEPVDQAGKELVSAHAARLCAAAGFDAAIVTKEGGGNADGDMALKIDALEERGIYDERLALPSVSRALGGERVELVGEAATAPLEVPTAVVYCALSPLGWGRLTCREAA
jgi:glycine reductase